MGWDDIVAVWVFWAGFAFVDLVLVDCGDLA